MTPPDHPSSRATTAEVAREIAIEQAHVDRVYAELTKAQARAGLVEADGMARGRTDRTGDVRDEELTGLFERDALVFNAARRRSTLDTQYEGLVFGRLDLDHAMAKDDADPDRETRYIGRLGVRDDDYEPLVVDWRAPAAAAFYRATPVEPMDVLRRRVLRCKGADVVGVEDDLMVAEAPDDLVVVGDGALLAALTRSRGAQMRDIVATIQRHQDEAIRASARGVTEITGGPGTGKTVVALHRAAYLLYSDRRRFESGGILVVGPSSAYTAYIERVLPSLGEESVTLRSLGDVLDGVTATRLDPPARGGAQGQPAGTPPARPGERRRPARGTRGVPGVRQRQGRARRPAGARPHPRAGAARPPSATSPAGRCAPRSPRPPGPASARATAREFMDRFEDHLEVEAFLEAWWPQVDPREVLLWLVDPERVRRHGHGVLSARGVRGVRGQHPHGPRDGHVVGRRRRPRRRPRRPARLGAGRPGRGARLLRDRGARGRLAVRGGRGGPRRPGPRRPPARPAAPRRPTRASGCWPAGSTRPVTTPTCSSTRRRTSRPCSGGCSAAAAATRRGPSSATPPRRPGRTPSRRAGPARRPSAPSSGGCSTWTPTTATPARSSTTRRPSCAATCRTPTSRGRSARRGWTPSSGVCRATGSPRRRPRRSRRSRREVEGTIAVITPGGPRRRAGGARRRRRLPRGRHRPDVDQGPGVRRDGRRRPRRDRGRVAGWRPRPLRRADPRGPPDDRPPARLTADSRPLLPISSVLHGLCHRPKGREQRGQFSPSLYASFTNTFLTHGEPQT